MTLKILLTLSVFLLAGNFSTIAVSAEDMIESKESIYDVLHYENHGDYIEITSCDACMAVVIPEKIENLPVTLLKEGAFSGNASIKEIYLPDTIQIIPAEAFKNCSNLTAVSLPSSLKQIGQNAFYGCEGSTTFSSLGQVQHQIEDIFYKGTSAEWDNIYVCNGNELLKYANLHCEFNHSEKNTGFETGKDDWSFTNNDLEKYMLSDNTIEKYFSEYGDFGNLWIKIYRDDLTRLKYYKGACAGMAAVSFLVSNGVLRPSDIYKDAETLYEIPLCNESIEAITYYFIQQFEPLRLKAITNNEFNAQEVLKCLQNNKAVLLSYYMKKGGHGIVAYGLEYGEWKYNEKIYTGRILTYDNNTLNFKDSTCIYFTGEFEQPYIPAYDSVIKDVTAITNPDIIFYGIKNSVNYIPTYQKGCLNQDDIVNSKDAAEILIASALMGAGNENGLNNGQEYAADVNIDGKINAEDAAIVLQYSASVGCGSFSGTLTEFIESK